MRIKLLDFGYEEKPKRQLDNDAGADVHSTISWQLSPGQTRRIPLGFGLDLPDGLMAIMMPRSGHANKGIISQVAPADSGYKGELHAIVTNTNQTNTVKIEKGERVAQLVIVPIILAEFEEELGKERGVGAFGSTGK